MIVPVVRFFFFPNTDPKDQKTSNIPLSLLIGGIICLLSGMIGIGGGIILSPVLILLKWTDQKQTAAISAAFIFVNSVSGLAGQLVKGISFTTDIFLYKDIAFVGGIAGAYFGSLKLPQTALKYVWQRYLPLPVINCYLLPHNMRFGFILPVI